MRNNKPKYLSKSDALAKLQKFCAYQDRCHQEVRTKLLDLGIYGDDLEEIIYELISENFLNEERFAKSYARGKFRMRRWGRNRILRELKIRKISDYCIRKALMEIDETEYLQALHQVLQKRRELSKENNAFVRNNKLAKYAIGRGFEPHLVWESIKNMEE